MESESIEQKSLLSQLRPKLIDRYVISEFLVSYLIALVVLLLLRVMLDLFVEFDEFVKVKPGDADTGFFVVLGKVFEYYWPKFFEYFRDFSGTTILAGAVFSLVRMTRNNELTAILACGVSLKRLIAPIVFLAVLLNIVAVLDQELILPRLADKLTRRHDEMRRLDTITCWLLPDRDGSLLSTFQYDPQSESMYNMHVIFRNEGRLTGQLFAAKAVWDDSSDRWRLEGGRYKALGAGEGGSLPYRSIEYYESDLTPDYLVLQRNSRFKRYMSSSQLNALLSRGLKPSEHAEAVSEKHFRFTDPIVNMAMLLLGLPLLISRQRSSTKTAVFLAFAGAGGCFVAVFISKLLAGSVVDPLLAAWLPILIFLPLSVLTLEGIET